MCVIESIWDIVCFIWTLSLMYEEHSRRFSGQIRSQQHRNLCSVGGGVAQEARRNVQMSLRRSPVFVYSTLTLALALITKSSLPCLLLVISFFHLHHVLETLSPHLLARCESSGGSHTVLVILTLSRGFTGGRPGETTANVQSLWLRYLSSHIQPLRIIWGDYPEFSACLRAAVVKLAVVFIFFASRWQHRNICICISKLLLLLLSLYSILVLVDLVWFIMATSPLWTINPKCKRVYWWFELESTKTLGLYFEKTLCIMQPYVVLL